ncbi:hypothetical protein U1Q18_037858 [Sarracenia purpurea var. burkii]
MKTRLMEAVILEEELRVKQPSTVGNEVEETHIIGTDVAEKENEGNDGKSDVENKDESSDGGDGSSTEGLLSEHEACITEQGTKTEVCRSKCTVSSKDDMVIFFRF